ncbi:MAG: hypothetical protein BGP03_04010 [Pseudonocardia sp. 73-21]|nr:MAG: hypothetical protein BGP03_04010 [Pseudonocardia sp. 73-21]
MAWHRLSLFGFLSQSSRTKAVAVMAGVAHARSAERGDTSARRGDLDCFRRKFYTSSTLRAEALLD